MQPEITSIINEVTAEVKNRLKRESVQNEDLIMQRINKLSAILKGEAPEDDSLFNSLDTHWGFNTFLSHFLLKARQADIELDTDHFIIRNILKPENLEYSDHKWLIRTQFSFHLLSPYSPKTESYLKTLYERGFTDKMIITTILDTDTRPYFVRNKSKKDFSGFGTYLKNLLSTKKSLLGRNPKHEELIHKIVLDEENRRSRDNLRLGTLEFFLRVNPQLIGNKMQDYLSKVHWEYTSSSYLHDLDLDAISVLVKEDPLAYKEVILNALDSYDTNFIEEYSVYYQLHMHTDSDYREKLNSIWEDYASKVAKSTNAYSGSLYIKTRDENIPLSHGAMALAFDESKDTGLKFLDGYFDKGHTIHTDFISKIDETLKEECLPYLMKALKQDTSVHYRHRYFFKTFCEILEKYDYDTHLERLLEYCIKDARRNDLETLCVSLSKNTPTIIANAIDLLHGSTVAQRKVGALILSHISDPDVEATLNDAVDKEKNDKTRNVILEALKERRFSSPYNLDQVQEMIRQAGDRKKLKWTEKVLMEAELPALYWKNGKELSNEEVRFLFYRLKQVSGIGIDPEMKQAINQIDSSKSPKFALLLLDVFKHSNADAKLKHYLTLTGLLGGDEGLHKLNTLFRKCLTDKRTKMASYILGAIAMIGSDKALRIIEVISRKYANKKPKLAKAALEMLEAAASEHGLTSDELADKIIPDFDFEGVYKEIAIEGEIYRAFVNSDFKLIYYNEDNKSRKSLPKAATAEQKKAFREIAKEITVVSKSQAGRLEKYLVEGRQWKASEWEAFFQSNPIMFVFAMKLLWSVFDEEGNFVKGFYCDEDTSLYDHEDEEIELDEGHSVGIMHPLDMNDEQRKIWQDKVYDMGFITVFPTINRSIFAKNSAESNLNHTKHFSYEDIPRGADHVVSYLVKKGWTKHAGDGGHAYFTKTLFSHDITAVPQIDGPYVYYQGGNAKAALDKVYFRKSNHQDKLILSDIPDKWYSEIMNDLKDLLNE